jgi:hypothetical protein
LVDSGDKYVAGLSTTLAINENQGQNVFTGVNDSCDKFIATVVEQLIAGVIDTGDEHKIENISANFL